MPAPVYNREFGIAAQLWEAKISEVMQQKGISRQKAKSYVAKRYPRLRDELIYEANPDQRPVAAVVTRPTPVRHDRFVKGDI